jgi:hypothetical protein
MSNRNFNIDSARDFLLDQLAGLLDKNSRDVGYTSRECKGKLIAKYATDTDFRNSLEDILLTVEQLND